MPPPSMEAGRVARRLRTTSGRSNASTAGESSSNATFTYSTGRLELKRLLELLA